MITDEDKIMEAMDTCVESGYQYSGMNYEQGIVDALNWILGRMTDEDFEYSK